MASALFFDISQYDVDHPMVGPDEIEATNPQRGHMRQLDAIVWMNERKSLAIGYKDVSADEFWVDGHIPGRPLLPGVLMIEAAAQLAAYLMQKRLGGSEFIGFVACNNVKFRGQVIPGDRLFLLGKELRFSGRRFVCASQGVVNQTLVFEAEVTGMRI